MRDRTWTHAAGSFAVVVILTLAVYHDTVASLARIWARSETFAYGFLVVPATGYLIWLKRRSLTALPPRPAPLALLALPFLGLVWLAGRATATTLVQQGSLVAFVPVLVLAFFGTRVTRAIAFPLAFLVFAVPFGDGLRPPLMNITADIAVSALHLSGVPVAKEGVFLTTPNATWRIAEACSGLQFLASGFVLTCLFAYATFRATWKRLACIGLSVGVLVLANGFRAYTLILMGYLTDMRLGRGPEHRALGYVIYGLVLLAYYAACSRFRDRTLAEDPQGREPGEGTIVPVRRPGAWIGLAGAALLAVLPWPPLEAHLSRVNPRVAAAAVSAPDPRGGWSLSPDPGPSWTPPFAGTASEAVQSYAKGNATVTCYLGFYQGQGEGRKLIPFGNEIARTDDLSWRNAGERDRTLRLEGEALAVRETDVRTRGGRVLVWHWYWIPDEFTASVFRAKLLQAQADLLHGRDHAAVVVLAASGEIDGNLARDLEEFAGDMLPSIRASLHRADGSP
jgi:exosortase A